MDVLRATRRETQRIYRYTSQYHLRRFRNHDFEGCSCSSCREWLRFNLHKFEYSNLKEELATRTTKIHDQLESLDTTRVADLLNLSKLRDLQLADRLYSLSYCYY